jgi:hypothetical protein
MNRRTDAASFSATWAPGWVVPSSASCRFIGPAPAGPTQIEPQEGVATSQHGLERREVADGISVDIDLAIAREYAEEDHPEAILRCASL